MKYGDDRVNLITPSTSTCSRRPSIVYPLYSLTWDDFVGTPDETSQWSAYTFWKINYKYNVKFEKKNVKIDLKVNCLLDKRSWTKTKEDFSLLRHEQGHFNIGLICALEFKKRASQFKFTKNYQTELQALFKQTLDEYLILEKTYDDDTCHYKNKEKQGEWDSLIEKSLDEHRRLDARLYY